MLTTTELAAKCRREIEARLMVCEAAPAEKWFLQSDDLAVVATHPAGGEIVADCYGDKMVKSATFIAASRNERPGELRGWLDILTIADGDDDWMTLNVVARVCGIEEYVPTPLELEDK